MPQLNFEYNIGALNDNAKGINQATLSFVPFIVRDSISFATMNIAMEHSGAGGKTNSISIGLYSLNGSTLSLANSISRTATYGGGGENYYVSLADTSATQNITPGTWWWGFLFSTAGANRSLIGGVIDGLLLNAVNAFPGAFIGGAMTDSTNALPSSMATSDLDTTGSGAMFVPFIILSA